MGLHPLGLRCGHHYWGATMAYTYTGDHYVGLNEIFAGRNVDGTLTITSGNYITRIQLGARRSPAAHL